MVTDIRLSEVLTLTQVGAQTHHDYYSAESIRTPHGRIYGGQVLGQAVMAAGATVPDSREIHSLHCYFIRPGDAARPITFEVAHLNDGRSFSVRRVQVFQEREVIMSFIASFQERQNGLEHQEHLDMSKYPDPDALESQTERYAHLSQEGRASWVLSRPFELRYTTSDILLSVDDQSPRQALWIRAKESLPNSRLIHRAALAFGSDYTLVETILRAQGIAWATPGIRAASLDHAMWFHRDFRADEWLLYVHESPTAQGGRGITYGKFYSASGDLVASVAQEAMVRLSD